MAHRRTIPRRIILAVLPLALATVAAFAAGSAQTAQPHYQLLWLNGKPVCPAGSKLVTSSNGKLMCVAVPTAPH